jgi:hypothetical protein
LRNGYKEKRRIKMKWLETIHIQASEGQQQIVKKHLLDLSCHLLESDRYPGLLSVEAYGHYSLESDHILYLKWKTDHMLQGGSVLGLRIKETLNKFGLTDYTIWHLIKGEDHE